MAKETQKQRILNDLKGGLYITPMDALKEHGCFRLAAVVHSLKKRGYDIITNIKTDMNGSKYAEYSLSDRDSNQLELSF